jgi:hypothetical protein
MTWVASAVVGGSYISGRMAQKGAQTQADAMRESAAYQKEMFDIQNKQQRPYRKAGYAALNDITAMKPYLTKQFGQEDFEAGIDPSYNFRLAQGNLATTNLANQAGGLVGGNALQGLTNYGQNLASTEFGNAFNRFQTQRSNIYNNLASIAGLGQTSLGQTGQLAGTVSQGVGGAISGAGSALGAGQVAMGNALGGGLQTFGNQQYLSTLLGPRGAPSSNYNIAPANYGITQSNPDMGGAQGVRFTAS